MKKLPRNISVLGLVSFLTDLSSEMIIPVILPLYMQALGVALPMIGLVEGAAESASSLLKLASGWFSDRIGKRKSLVGIGYLISSLSKPLFALAGVWWHFLGIRLIERTGKGIRTAPRDALIAASVDEHSRGVSFGFHRAMDTAGAFLGLLSALLLVWVLKMEPEDFAPLFVIAFIPAIIAVIILFVFAREKAPTVNNVDEPADGPVFSSQYKLYILIVGLFTLGNSSDAFLAIRANDAGLSPPKVIGLMLVMNAVYASLATWFGGLSDRISRRGVLTVSFIIYAGVYFAIAFATEGWLLWPIFAIYGLYYALSRGALRAMVADMVIDRARGKAYGFFNMVQGIVAVPSSVIMGALWEYLGMPYAFSFGAALALIAALLLALFIREPSRNGKAD